MKVIDLSYLIDEDMTVYPGTERPSLVQKYNIEENGFRETKISIFSHVGTHIDAPAHMLKNGKYLDEFQVDKFVGSAMVLDFSGCGSRIINLNDIQKYEEKISGVDFVIINTGWYRHWGTDKYFKDYPILSLEAVQWLAKLSLKGVGVDAISLDFMESEEFYAHNTLLNSGFIIIENLTNLEAIGDEIFTLSVLPLKYKGADGAPVRAVAII